MAVKLIRHGSEAGYRTELQTGNSCPRCQTAHREYTRQYSMAGKRAGLKYTRDQVIDHLAKSVVAGPRPGMGKVRPATAQPVDHDDPTDAPESDATGLGDVGESQAPRPSLADRVRGLWVPGVGDDYVSEPNTPDYLHTVDPDPEPAGEEWAPVSDDEFVINAAGIKKIEENLGTYVSIVGITLEMIDPYCGEILEKTLPKMVEKWSKVIAHYPPAAKLFLDSKGGILMTWIAAIQATWPFLYAVYEHHLAKTVRTHDGIVERKVANGFRGFDSTTPPMPDNFAYSVR